MVTRLIINIRPEDKIGLKIQAIRNGMTMGNYISFMMARIPTLEKKICEQQEEAHLLGEQLLRHFGDLGPPKEFYAPFVDHPAKEE